MNTDREKTKKKQAFFLVFLATGLGTLGLGLGTSSLEAEGGAILSETAMLSLNIFALFLFSLAFVWFYERVNHRPNPLLMGLLYGFGVWSLCCFPLFLLLSAFSIFRLSAYVFTALGSLGVLLINGIVTAYFLKDVRTKSLDDTETAIG